MPKPPTFRYHFVAPAALGEQLEAAAARGTRKSAIVVEALTAWFARKGDDELELRFAHRLNRLTNHQKRIERNTRYLIESHSVFVRYMMTVNAPVAEGDEEARERGRRRYEAFRERVAFQLGKGFQTRDGEEDDE